MDRILITDDDLHLRKLVYTYADAAGYSCDEASCGEEALEKIQKETYSLIVLDIMMPGMDGFEVLAKIRETSQVPVIMLTARNEEYDKLLSFNLGVDDYLSKPFSPKELIARIGAVLKRMNTTANQNFRFDGLFVDIEARAVRVNNEKVSLSPKEFDLLVKLIQNEHKVMTREQLLESVWGYDYLGDTRTVDTHIKDLRDHLGEYRRFIQTAWGVGYKFEHNENN